MNATKSLSYQQRVGIALRRERTHRGFTQEEFAGKIRMHRTYYSAIERGEKNLTLHTLAKVSEALGCTPSLMLTVAERIGARGC